VSRVSPTPIEPWVGRSVSARAPGLWLHDESFPVDETSRSTAAAGGVAVAPVPVAGFDCVGRHAAQHQTATYPHKEQREFIRSIPGTMENKDRNEYAHKSQGRIFPWDGCAPCSVRSIVSLAGSCIARFLRCPEITAEAGFQQPLRFLVAPSDHLSSRIQPLFTPCEGIDAERVQGRLQAA